MRWDEMREMVEMVEMAREIGNIEGLERNGIETGRRET